VTFKWKYYRSLEASEAFQVLIWKEGEQQHLGAAELWRQTEQTINLDDILPARGGPGYYNWTVVVVNRTNEKPFSREATPWRFRYVGRPQNQRRHSGSRRRNRHRYPHGHRHPSPQTVGGLGKSAVHPRLVLAGLAMAYKRWKITRLSDEED